MLVHHQTQFIFSNPPNPQLRCHYFITLLPPSYTPQNLGTRRFHKASPQPPATLSTPTPTPPPSFRQLYRRYFPLTCHNPRPATILRPPPHNPRPQPASRKVQPPSYKVLRHFKSWVARSVHGFPGSIAHKSQDRLPPKAKAIVGLATISPSCPRIRTTSLNTHRKEAGNNRNNPYVFKCLQAKLVILTPSPLDLIYVV